MRTLLVKGKGIDSGTKVQDLASRERHYSPHLWNTSFKWLPQRFWHRKPRWEARFHNLSHSELNTLIIKLSFIDGITKVLL